MKSRFIIITAVFSIISIMFSCGTKKTKKSEVVETKSDTVTVVNKSTHTITKTIHDTIYVETTIEKTKKLKAPSLNAWNNSARKKITSFVKSVTDIKSKNYLEPSDRIAVMDMEGTLWPEKPVYFQLEFMFDRIKEMAKDHPEWKKNKLIKAVLSNDLKSVKKFGSEGLYKLSTITQSGMTTDEYNKIVLKWINNAKHPTKGMLYKDMIYLPMLQLIEYLKHYDFSVFIVTEGGSGFLRPWVEDATGIASDNIVASRRKYTYSKSGGKIVLIRDPEIEFITNKENKIIAIQQNIGKVPVIAIGNSDDDIPMLEWTTQRKGKTLVALIHHTDANREWAYDKNSSVGKLSKGLKLASEKGWFVVDMKKDWGKIFMK